MGEIISLQAKPAVVIACKPPSRQPSVIVGASCSLPGLDPLAFVAHLTPDDAEALADRMKEAAQAVREATAGQPSVLERMAAGETFEEEPRLPPIPGISESEHGTPPITPAQARGDEALLMTNSEMAGVPCQVQKPLKDGEPSWEPGMLGCSLIAGPDGERKVMVLVNHADGTSLAAILEREDYLGFGDCFMEVGAGLGLQGRPH